VNAPTPGTTIGTYTLERLLGQGGFAWVFAARRADGKPFAIKTLKPRFSTDEAFRNRFRQESQFAAQLKHSHIVHIEEVSPEEDGTWFAMDLYPDSLAARLEREGKIGEDQIIQFGHDIAAALSFAHEQGIVHRDIKPDNILRGPLGGYMLLDFGIAKALATPAALTGTGMAIGTPRYMSPEQLMAREVSAATDQYALATVAFELLTGRAPFESDNVHGIMMEKLGGPPPPATRFNPAVPAGAGRALARALSPEPEARFGTVGEFVTALRAE
jgi:serine/threonine-protein kinase